MLPGVQSLEALLRSRLPAPEHLLLVRTGQGWQASVKNRHGAFTVAINDDPVAAIVQAILEASN